MSSTTHKSTIKYVQNVEWSNYSKNTYYCPKIIGFVLTVKSWNNIIKIRSHIFVWGSLPFFTSLWPCYLYDFQTFIYKWFTSCCWSFWVHIPKGNMPILMFVMLWMGGDEMWWGHWLIRVGIMDMPFAFARIEFLNMGFKIL